MISFGVIGIGFMGRGIAKNAILKGSNIGLKSVSLYDVNQSQIQQLLKEEMLQKAQTPTKVEVLDKVTDIFRRNDIVALSLPSEEVCKSLLFDAKEGIVTNMKAVSSSNNRKIIIDHSTYSKKFVQYCSEKAKDIAGVEYIDAPVSGGPLGAWNGTLSVMMGGNKEIVPSILSYLSLYSSTQKYFGASGCGMAAKLVNQALVGIHAQAACEAIRLAEKLGLDDLVQLKDLLSASWGQSKILDLVLADFITAKQQSSNSSFEAALQVLQETKSAAPLRNMDKDFACIEKEISVNSSLNILNSYPLLKDTQEKIHKACTESRLKDAPFASLTIVE